MAGTPFCLEGKESWRVEGERALLELPAIGLQVSRTLTAEKNGCSEVIHLHNYGTEVLQFTALDFGYLFPLMEETLYAIPFTVQQDGMRHVYCAETLQKGQYRSFVNNDIPAPGEMVYGNSVYSDPCRTEPPLTEEGRLRSEAWFWGGCQGGLLVAKYNNDQIEYAIAEPVGDRKEWLRLGGVGFCLYCEPSGARTLTPGATFTFGKTYYVPCENFETACTGYRNILSQHGHDFPEDYEPNVHWNELYDVGWFHSDRTALYERYTQETLLEEARKAQACGCDALYLDPGWEYAEGTSFFDYHRLGDEKDFVTILKSDYGLDLSIRCILRTYINYWPDKVNVVHTENGIATACMTPRTIVPSKQILYEQCLCYDAFFEEKLKRIEKLIAEGASWLMLDEMDWRGPCYSHEHGHSVPTTAYDHAYAVCELSRRIKNKYHIPVEVHDPIWSWNSAVYTPTYWKQGFGNEGFYSENWGFEFMWECIHDLQSGKALSLYYYNLGCNIPLYLHINMSADNDHCLFFWWAASTIRHLGIGGKNCHPSVVPPGKQFWFDPEQRFAAYQDCMRQYKALKAYYQRGQFHGIHEYAHLHTLESAQGGVLDLFNCTDEERLCTARIPMDILKGENLAVVGATARIEGEKLVVETQIPGLSHVLVRIGDAAAIAL